MIFNDNLNILEYLGIKIFKKQHIVKKTTLIRYHRCS